MPRVRLRAGIFAAGAGARLVSPDGLPKGLMPVAGRPLVDWILDDLYAAGVSDVVMIVNEQSLALRDHVAQTRPERAVQSIVETTPSSMHSFLRVLETLAANGDEGPFLISTVDTIALPGTFADFVDAAHRSAADVTLALTTRIDDDRPLRVDIGEDKSIGVASAFTRTIKPVLAIGRGAYATAGYYFVRPTVLTEADAVRQANLGALRHFFAHLFAQGYRMAGICMPESVDVDQPEDVKRADKLLQPLTARAREARSTPATKQ